MGIMGKFKDFIGYPSEDEWEGGEGDPVQPGVEGGGYYGDGDEYPDDGYARRRGSEKRDNKVVNIHATTQLQVVLVKPERFEDAKEIADHLCAKRTVVLNLESATKDVSRRLTDFLSGVAYANNGQIKKVANSTYIITPYNVGVMGDLLDELESNGVFF